MQGYFIHIQSVLLTSPSRPPTDGYLSIRGDESADRPTDDRMQRITRNRFWRMTKIRNAVHSIKMRPGEKSLLMTPGPSADPSTTFCTQSASLSASCMRSEWVNDSSRSVGVLTPSFFFPLSGHSPLTRSVVASSVSHAQYKQQQQTRLEMRDEKRKEA